MKWLECYQEDNGIGQESNQILAKKQAQTQQVGKQCQNQARAEDSARRSLLQMLLALDCKNIVPR